MRRGRRLSVPALPALVALGALAATVAHAAADPPRPLRLLSTGALTATGAAYAGASSDGTRVFFATVDRVAAEDTDTAADVYAHEPDGSIALVSAPGPINQPATFAGASDDGRRVFFRTAELLAGDTDGADDVYAREPDGRVTLVSTPASGIDAATFVGASADGSRVIFSTREKLIGDSDDAVDLYAREPDGRLTLLTTPGSGTRDATYEDCSPDGRRVIFTTSEKLTDDDDDDADDLYAREPDGRLTLISTTSPGNEPVAFAGASADRGRVLFETREALSADDADTAVDVYAREADGRVTLVSSPGGVDQDATYRGASADGRRVIFSTAESVLPGDADTGTDLYAREPGGTLTLVSTSGPANGAATFKAISADGGRVLFQSVEALTGSDLDSALDIFARGPGDALTLVSSPTSGVLGNTYRGASADARHVAFSTDEAISPADTDTAIDVYLSGPDETIRLVSTGGSGTTAALFNAISASGGRVVFTTAEALSEDVNAANDVYERALVAPAFTSESSLAGTPLRGSTLTCVPGAISGEFVETAIAWLRDGAPIAGAAGSAYSIVDADVGQALECRVTATNPVGSASQTSSALAARAPVAGGGGPTADVRAPSVRILAPSCARKSRAACRTLLGSVRAWSTLRGTATDPAPSSGLARVEVSVVRKDGRQCMAYNGRRFEKAACGAAAKRFVRAGLAGDRWSLRVRGLRLGTYVVRVRAADRRGNVTTSAATRTLRISRKR